MQNLHFFLLFAILASQLTGCASTPTSQPIKSETTQTSVLSASPTESVSSSTDSDNPHLNCLSPALKMNEARAAHTATLLPDGRVLIAGGFREEGTSEIAIASAEIFDPKTNSFIPTSDMNAPRNGHTATLLPNG
ncbi:MAG TPA: kelch repeat-containing protein, partial [Anaerolineales bacterium]|nr:kelch repeat-containing protein [Anaerolineales bacterium]